ncbi:hypothetical protein [Candidiatus Paracoxiella cheracis]|uniref:hypothetical protein n=1 Tax=Candidiatus Paracoxiella cheracis TaxID=3405120 RepID=UPI003BF5B56B
MPSTKMRHHQSFFVPYLVNSKFLGQVSSELGITHFFRYIETMFYGKFFPNSQKTKQICERNNSLNKLEGEVGKLKSIIPGMPTEDFEEFDNQVRKKIETLKQGEVSEVDTVNELLRLYFKLLDKYPSPKSTKFLVTGIIGFLFATIAQFPSYSGSIEALKYFSRKVMHVNEATLSGPKFTVPAAISGLLAYRMNIPLNAKSCQTLFQKLYELFVCQKSGNSEQNNKERSCQSALHLPLKLFLLSCSVALSIGNGAASLASAQLALDGKSTLDQLIDYFSAVCSAALAFMGCTGMIGSLFKGDDSRSQHVGRVEYLAKCFSELNPEALKALESLSHDESDATGLNPL